MGFRDRGPGPDNPNTFLKIQFLNDVESFRNRGTTYFQHRNTHYSKFMHFVSIKFIYITFNFIFCKSNIW